MDNEQQLQEEEIAEQKLNKNNHHPSIDPDSPKSSHRACTKAQAKTAVSPWSLSKQEYQQTTTTEKLQERQQQQPNDQKASQPNIPIDKKQQQKNSNQFAPVATENARDLTKNTKLN